MRTIFYDISCTKQLEIVLVKNLSIAFPHIDFKVELLKPDKEAEVICTYTVTSRDTKYLIASYINGFLAGFEEGYNF